MSSGQGDSSPHSYETEAWTVDRKNDGSEEADAIQYDQELLRRMQPVVIAEGRTLRCTTCNFNILLGEYTDK
eukprot:10459190-Karenia_brevis.AAC.1